MSHAGCGRDMEVYCITAKTKKHLAAAILRKRKDGYRRHGRVCSIGGAYVQGMVVTTPTSASSD